jgi:formyl-CoA transferase
MPSVINHPLNVEGLATRPAGPAPDLGEHSEAILAELGYTPTDIARAKEQGVI